MISETARENQFDRSPGRLNSQVEQTEARCAESAGKTGCAPSPNHSRSVLPPTASAAAAGGLASSGGGNFGGLKSPDLTMYSFQPFFSQTAALKLSTQRMTPSRSFGHFFS